MTVREVVGGVVAGAVIVGELALVTTPLWVPLLLLAAVFSQKARTAAKYVILTLMMILVVSLGYHLLAHHGDVEKGAAAPTTLAPAVDAPAASAAVAAAAPKPAA
jgi:hypothetical protein